MPFAPDEWCTSKKGQYMYVSKEKSFLSVVAGATLLAVLYGTPTAADQIGDSIAEAGRVDTQLTDELKLANEAFIDAFVNRDIWAMGQLWAKEEYVSAILPATGKPAYGWENVRKSWQQTFDHNRDIKIKSLAGLILAQGDKEGDLAWIVDSTQFESFQTQTGQPVMLPNVLTTKVFERRDGKWLLAHYHAHQPRLNPPTATHEESGSGALVSDVAPELRAVDERFYQALRDRDLQAMNEIWSPSESVTAIQPEGQIPFMGRDNVMASWERLFDYNKTIQIPPVSQSTIHLAGNKAWLVGSYQAGLTRKSGEYVHLPDVLVTKLFEKENGTWRLVHYHAHIGPLAHGHGPQEASGADSLGSLKPTRTIELEAKEMTFGVDKLQVKPGEVIRFVVTNKGTVRHEFALGRLEEHLQMRAMMRQMPDMIHNSDSVITLEPGETKELIWRVPDDPNFEFSCNIPGHAESGMTGTLELEKK